MATPIKFKRNSSSGWAADNTVLAAGEPGFERNTGNLKIGNGVTPWNDLPYVAQQLNPTITSSGGISGTNNDPIILPAVLGNSSANFS
jgi:hypothetical protein